MLTQTVPAGDPACRPPSAVLPSDNVKPIFRADHVGSLLRMPLLKQARKLFSEGRMSAGRLKQFEDRSIRQVVTIQQDAGLQTITDGEQRRNFFHVDFLQRIGGVEVSIAGYEIKFRGGNRDVAFAPPILRVTGRLTRPAGGIATDDLRFLRTVVGYDKVLKVCIPSPSMLHFRGGRRGVSIEAYPDMEEFFADLARVYREEIADLYALGCRYLQLDDTNLAYLCDPAHRDRARKLGEDPDLLPSLYARLISECVKERPADMTVGVHLCRGNHRSCWAAEGGYEPVAEIMFNETDVDAFFLEYDDARSGDFYPLRFVPRGKAVVLGLVCSKVPRLEARDDIKRRLEEASRVIPLEQCALSPQCGFSSTHEGNDLGYGAQFEKLKLVVDVAAEVWG